jgi:hypothetical protein
MSDGLPQRWRLGIPRQSRRRADPGRNLCQDQNSRCRSAICGIHCRRQRHRDAGRLDRRSGCLRCDRDCGGRRRPAARPDSCAGCGTARGCECPAAERGNVVWSNARASGCASGDDARSGAVGVGGGEEVGGTQWTRVHVRGPVGGLRTPAAALRFRSCGARRPALILGQAFYPVLPQAPDIGSVHRSVSVIHTRFSKPLRPFTESFAHPR